MIKNIIKKVLLPDTKLFKKGVMSNGKQHLFFVHVPKTAGSSFRGAFEKSAVTYKDYGNKSKNTSEVVQKNVHDKKDFYTLKACFNQHNLAWLTGHVSLAKYINFVPVTHTVSFVREPLEQVLSHYNHYVKYHGFTGDLNAFLDKPYAKNLQSKLLDFIPLNLIGCLGLTEHYDDSLALINNQFKLTLPIVRVNVNKTKILTAELLNEDLKLKFANNNQRDIDMYAQAELLHLQRFKLFQENKPWTYGFATVNSKNLITGCAYQHDNNNAITLIVKLNNKYFKKIIALDYYTEYFKVNFPRARYIGFSVSLPKTVKDDDIIDVYVEETGQKLNFTPLKVKVK